MPIRFSFVCRLPFFVSFFEQPVSNEIKQQIHETAYTMKKSRKTCNIKWLYRYLDGELGRRENALAQKHVQQCALCQKVLNDNQVLAKLYRAKIDGELSRVDLHAVETTVVVAIENRSIPWWSRLGDFLVSKRFYVPATALVGSLILLGFFMRPTPSVSGPSATISSLKGDMGSVMILETPKSQQTVIWFDEPVAPNGQNQKPSEGGPILGFFTQAIHPV